jgi:large subunit ribosomal protein L4
MKLSQLTLIGAKRTTEVTLNDDLFGPINPELLAQAVSIYRSNLRQGGAKTQDRGDVNRTKTKWYKQKGTGRARHGARSANLFIGGAVAHGPTGLENYTKRITPKMKKAALRSALAMTAATSNVLVGSGLDAFTGKTKEAFEVITRINPERTEKILFVIAGEYDKFRQAMGNIPEATLTRADRVNALEVATADKVVILKEAVEVLEKRLARAKKEVSE